jgi:hypothetical protein
MSQGDNFKVEITAGDGSYYKETRNILLESLRLAMARHGTVSHFGATASLVQDRKLVSPARLTLYWSGTADGTPFPAYMTAELIEPIVRTWLADQEYGPQPDHDGDNGKGWYIGAGTDYVYQVTCYIEPRWITYGK